MADIRLAKPAAGTTQTVPSAPDGRFIFDFPADAATLTRNGDDLVLTFEDGAAIQLQGFYTTYSKEDMPSFQVEGVEISGQDFFAALDEDLMPAAGPASGSSAARGGRYNEYGGSDLLDGLDHLGRLDIGFDGGTQLATDTVEPSPYSEVDHGVTVTPSTPGTDPDDPSIPVQGEDFPPTMPHDVLQVDESALDGGSGGGSATAAGSMRVSAPDGVAIITIGGVVVWQNGALTGNPVLTDEGHLDVTGFDGTNLTYTYTLTGSTQEHAKLNAGGENDAIAHEMAVVVTDRDGDSGSAVIRVEITDDVPTIKSFERDVTEGATAPVEGNALEGSAAGADGADFAWTNPTQQGQYGTITLNPNGSYSYTLDNNNAEVKALTDGQRLTEEFTYTYTDADGDVAEGKVTITINGVNNGVEVGSGTLTVYEAGLDDGSTPGGDNTPTTASGSLHINAPDGVATIAIGEVTVFKNGALTGNTVSTDEGTLTVTGFDAATGELTFTYTLNDNTLGHGLDGMDTHVSHDFAVTVTDVDGSRDTGEVTVVITDDGPMVTPVEIEYNGKKYVNTVSVSFGADNDTGTGSSLAVNAYDDEGTAIAWTKVDDSTTGSGSTPCGNDLSNLSEGESWTNGNIIVSRENGNFVFKIKENGSNAHIRVTATDADGDTNTEELNLTAPDAGPNAIIVDEALLSDGNVVNSDNSDHAPSGTDSFTVNLNGEDGTVTLKYGTGEDASTITLSLINGEQFNTEWLSTNTTLTVNGVEVEVKGATQTEPGGPWKIEYTYKLTGQQAHKNGGSAGAVGADDALSDSINITVTDATGDMTTGSLMVTVHDDGPVISDVRFENGYEGNESVSSNVDIRGSFELDYGADREAGDKALTVQINNGTAIEIEFAENSNSATVSTVLGELTVTRGEDGTYSYVIESGEPQKIETGDYTLTFTGKDSDGDTASTGAIHVRVKETTTVKLSVSPEDVTEGSTITYTATLVDENGNQAVNKGGDITVTLQHGETITIASGASSGSSEPVSTREDEAYVQGDETVSNQITNVSQAEGTSNFEHLVTDDTPVEVVVKDDNDKTTVTLSATEVVNGQYSLTVTVDNAPQTDLVLDLSNGQKITIAAGEMSATQSYDYVPGQSMDISVTGVEGQTDTDGNGQISYEEAGEGFYETLDFSGAETSTSYDAAKIVVKAEGGTEADDANDWKFTFELQDAEGNPVAAASDITVTYTDPSGQKQTITISKGESSAEVSIDSKNTEDVFKEAPTTGEVEITGISDSNIEGIGNSDSANITDTVDKTTVTLSATEVVNGQYSLTVTVDNAPQTDLVLDLSNGQKITIAAGEMSATQSYDYVPGQSMDISVTGVEGQTDTDGNGQISYEEAGEGFYETLDFSGAETSTSYDAAKIVVKAEGGTEETDQTNDWKFTFELQDAEGNPVEAASDITVTYTDPSGQEQTITISKGKSSAEVSIDSKNTEDVFKEAPTNGEVEITGISDSNIEGVGNSDSADITDTVDTTTVKLNATEVENGQYSLTVTVDNAPKSDLVLTLSNNQTITIEAGKTSATESYDYVPGQSMAISVTGVEGQTDADKNGQISYEEAGEGFYETLDFSGASVNLDIQAGGTVTSDDDDTKDDGIGQHEVIIQDSSVGTISQFAGGAGSVAVFQGENKIGELSIIDGKLFFTQTASYSHAEGEDSAVISQDVTVINASGAECELSIAITIEDSLPVAHADRLELETGRKAQGNLLSNDEESADGNTVVHSVTFNDTTKTFDSENNSITLDGRFGSLTVSADGQYTYTLNSNMEIPEAGTVSETFSYDIIDGDGDVSTASATLTILIGKGTLHVKESKTTINEQGQEIVIDGDLEDEKSLNAKITSVKADENSIKYDYDLPGLEELAFGDYEEVTGISGYDHVYETNYGNLYVNEDTGAYKFVLNDGVADPLPEGFEISMSFTMTTQDDLGNQGLQNIVVVIEGTNDQGTLTEAGKGGHSSSQMWLDAKATGTNTVEDPYDAVTDPNLGTTPNPDKPGSATENDDLGSDTTSRVITWLPFTLEDVDLNESVSFYAVYNGAYHSVPKDANMDGAPLQKYVDFLSAYPSTEYSVALSVAWHEFTQKFTSEELGNMLFYKTEGGIFVIVNDAVHVDGTGMDTAQNWLVFIADSDSDALRHMSEGSGTGAGHGIIYQFSFQVRDSNGEIVRTTERNEQGDITGYAETNNVLVHLYGSNDTPTMEIAKNGTFIIHDDDVTKYQSEEIEGNGKANADIESHTLKIIYNNKEFTGNLHGGEVSLWYIDEVLYVNVSINTSDGTNYTLSNIRDYENKGLDSDITAVVTDQYGNTAQYEMHVGCDGDVTAVSGPVDMSGTGDSDSLYGGNGSDTLNGGEGNDSLWGLANDDTLHGDAGNDRLYGGEGNDTLYGDAGTDVLVGGSGNDTLHGGDGNDVLIGDGQGGFQEIIEGTVNAETFQKYLDQQSVADLDGLIKKYDEMDLEGGDDKLFGGAGDDILIGGSGNDYLDGGAGEDAIFGGSGNDIIVYDKADYLVSGGSGIDFMVSDDSELTLDTLLSGGKDGQDGPIVDSIEVLLKGDAALSLTSIQELADKYGIELDTNPDGQETLTLDMSKWAESTPAGDTHVFTSSDGQLTLETNLQHDSDASSDNGEMAQQVFILEHTNS